MKTSNLFLLSLLLASSLGIQAQVPDTNSPNSGGQSALPPPTQWALTSSGPNDNIFQRTNYNYSPSGQVVAMSHTYMALATGLNHWSGGQWVPSSQNLSILANGSCGCSNCQHQTLFPPDIYSSSILLQTPEGLDLTIAPVALGYEDGSNTVLFSVLTNSTGELLSPGNQVLYPDAFPGLGDLMLINSLAGIEQDVILRAQPPDPAAFGLNLPTTRIMVLSEFINPPQPTVTATTMTTDAGELEDDNVSFGVMGTWPGKAFLMDTNWPPAPIGGVEIFKRWMVINQRNFLVEEVPLPDVADQLATLPLMAVNARASGALPVALRHLVLPPRRMAQSPTKTIAMAKAAPPARGLVLDYQLLNNNMTNFTFQSDLTYLITGSVVLSGTTTLEAAVIKFLSYTNSSSIACGGPIVCKTSAWHPAVLTADQDNTVGSGVGSYGDGPPYLPPSGYLAGYEALQLSSTVTNDLEYLRFCYLEDGLVAVNAMVRNCQFVSNTIPVQVHGPTTFENCLFQNSQTYAIGLSSSQQVNMQNCTVHDTPRLYYEFPSGTGGVTNCLLIGVTNVNLGFASVCNYTNINDAGIFQVVGGGGNYLAADCPSGIRGAGTTNIDPVLLAELQTKTTWPPIVYSNTSFWTPATFGPQAQRDCTGTLDCGCHYDPIDWVFGGVQVGANLAFTPGTSVGWFEITNGSYGLGMTNGASVTFNGTATAPCTFEQCNTVQEGDNGVWPVHGSFPGGITAFGPYNTNNPPVLAAQFTHFYQLAGDSDAFSDGAIGQPLVVQARHSEIWASYGGYDLMATFTNCLFVRCDFSQSSTEDYPYEILRNCTFIGGTFYVYDYNSTPYWYSSAYNSAFDGTSIGLYYFSGTYTNYADFNYNAFDYGASQPATEGPNTVVVTNGFNWQTNWFGGFYQSTNSPLIKQGSTTADQVGLYHFTTQTNQVIEGTNIVDIGYAYVAVTNGVPLDSNGDGIPDYLEDANGNGLDQSGEIGWNITGDLGLQIIITRPRSGGILP